MARRRKICVVESESTVAMFAVCGVVAIMFVVFAMFDNVVVPMFNLFAAMFAVCGVAVAMFDVFVMFKIIWCCCYVVFVC